MGPAIALAALTHPDEQSILRRIIGFWLLIGIGSCLYIAFAMSRYIVNDKFDIRIAFLHTVLPIVMPILNIQIFTTIKKRLNRILGLYDDESSDQ